MSINKLWVYLIVLISFYFSFPSKNALRFGDNYPNECLGSEMMMATTRFQREGTLPMYKGMNSQTYNMKKQLLYFVKEKVANHKSRWKLLLPHTKRKQKWTFILTSRRLLKIIKLPLFKGQTNLSRWLREFLH